MYFLYSLMSPATRYMTSKYTIDNQKVSQHNYIKVCGNNINKEQIATEKNIRQHNFLAFLSIGATIIKI